MEYKSLLFCRIFKGCEYEENEYKIKRKASQIFELAFVSHHCIDFDGCCNVCTGHTDGSRVFRIYRFIRYHCTDIKQRRNRPLLINELVNFATQYGTVQKQLLNDFEIPYALLDYNSRFLWMNEKFTEITGKDKNYHKSVTTVFPESDQGYPSEVRSGGINKCNAG